MSDRFQTCIRFGGAVQRSDLEPLAELIAEAGGSTDWLDGDYDVEELLAAAEAKESALVTDNEAHYETYDELCVWLTSRDLPWFWQQDGKYEIDGEVRVWFPGMDKPAAASASPDGEALVALSDLRKALDSGQTLEGFVANLAPFEREIPPLVVVDDATRSVEA